MGLIGELLKVRVGAGEQLGEVRDKGRLAVYGESSLVAENNGLTSKF